MHIHVLDESFTLVGLLGEFESVIWRPSYSDIGDFEIFVSANDKAIDLLQPGRYIVRSTDITVNSAGETTYKKVMIVKNLIINTDVENGDFFTVTGKELKFILHQRLVWSLTTLKGTVEDSVRRLVTENAIAPTDSKRKIPDLILGEKNLDDTNLEKQITANPLDESIVEICKTYNLGWNIYIHNKQMVFELYAGIDRSYSQSERPYVVFSDEFLNLYNTEYQKNTESFANTALVGGEGEGTERKYATYNGENSGLDRYEIFVNASGVKSEEGSEANYTKLLEEEGKNALSNQGVTEAFTGEIVNDMGFVYEVDFFIGDIVTVINKYGFTRNVRVMSAIESEDETGTKLIPQFNI